MNWRELLNTGKEYLLSTLQWFLKPVPMGSIGWGIPTLVGALFLTCVVYLFGNIILCSRVSSAIENERPDGFQDTMSAEEFRRRVRLATSAPAVIDRDPFASAFQVNASKKPVAFSQIYLELIKRIIRGDRAVDTNDASKDVIWKGIVDNQLTGQMSGWMIYQVSTQSISGQKLLDELAKVEPILQARLSEMKDGDKIREFLIKFAELAGQPAKGPIRAVNRFNGLVQWLTMWLFWVILLILLRRFMYVYQLKSADPRRLIEFKEFAVSQFPPALQNDQSAHEEAFREHARTTESSAYRTIEFLTTLLPSLGFIGTVVGMGDALLAADGLFASKDKQQTISFITQQLGYAFDTTLVALILGLIAGVVVVQCRLWENKQYAALGRSLFTHQR